MPNATATMLAKQQPNNNMGDLLGALGQRKNRLASTELLGALESQPVGPESELLQNPDFRNLQGINPEAAEVVQTKRAAIRSALQVEDEASERAFFTDMRNVKLRLEGKDIEGAMSILIARKQALGQIEGADTADVDRIINRIGSGDIEGAYEDLTLADNIAVQNNILTPVDAGENTTLGKGAILVGPNGEQIASNVQEEGSEGFADQRARKIDEYQRLFGMTVEEATRKVDTDVRMDDNGNLIGFDPISGDGNLVNVNTGDEPPVIAAPTGTSVEDLAFDPGNGTGFGASFIGLWNSTAGQIPFVPEGLETEEAAQELRLLTRDAIRALGSSGRPPVVEQERIAALIPQAMAWTQNPEVARFQMTNFVDLMMNQYVDDLRYSGNKRNPKAVRDASTARANNIQSIIRRVLTPEASQGMFESIGKIEGEMGEIKEMPFSELESLDVSTLSDAQLDAYIERIKAGDK